MKTSLASSTTPDFSPIHVRDTTTPSILVDTMHVMTSIASGTTVLVGTSPELPEYLLLTHNRKQLFPVNEDRLRDFSALDTGDAVHEQTSEEPVFDETDAHDIKQRLFVVRRHFFLALLAIAGVSHSDKATNCCCFANPRTACYASKVAQTGAQIEQQILRRQGCGAAAKPPTDSRSSTNNNLTSAQRQSVRDTVLRANSRFAALGFPTSTKHPTNAADALRQQTSFHSDCFDCGYEEKLHEIV
ncbi:hypothetical protein AC579_2330 [Pseudocercospora musae]|uniref:Uncharacterized protein n=1 Tax=Pseudocercospora musae TaxID=113226 RepID=A0A139H407_9PEZI|nr:hypothetical protein AC579_2330 [Pseudocercospora musae]